jgi:glycosyltransferase involved in cell wall biosynthesis
VIGAVRPLIATVLVVDDGSADDTAAVAAAAGAEVVRQPTNLGKGAALLAGFRALAARGFTHALTLDADGQHLPDQIPLLLAASASDPRALVVGVRQKSGHTIRQINRFGNWIADRLMARIARQPLPDTQCGFRIYPIEPVLALGAAGARFDFETEILLRAARRGIPLLGVPVKVHYPPVAERVSHYRPVVDTVRIIRTVLRVLAAG